MARMSNTRIALVPSYKLHMREHGAPAAAVASGVVHMRITSLRKCAAGSASSGSHSAASHGRASGVVFGREGGCVVAS